MKIALSDKHTTMKRMLLMLLIICICSFISLTGNLALAQTSVGFKGRIGLTVFDNYRVSSSFTYQPGISRGYSAFINQPISRSFSIQVEGGYEGWGGVTESVHPVWLERQSRTVYTDCFSEAELHYVSLAMMLRYSYRIGNGWSAYLQAGPGPRWLAAAYQVDKGYGYVYESDAPGTPLSYAGFDERRSIRRELHTLSGTLNAAAGVSWMSEGEYILLEAGMNRSIGSIERARPDGSQQVAAFYHVTLGYGVHLQKMSARGCQLRK